MDISISIYACPGYRVASKISRKLLSISSPNIDRFSIFFHRHILWKISNQVVTTYTKTPDLCRYTVVYFVTIITIFPPNVPVKKI